jgi:hypothetical protein
MERRECEEPSCTRRAVRGTPYCRTHGRERLRKAEEVIAATVREDSSLQSPDHVAQDSWEGLVASTLKGIAAEEDLGGLESRVEALSKLLAGYQGGNPLEALAQSGLWGEIKGSLSAITAKLKEHRVTFTALIGSGEDREEAEPRARALLRRLELYATCLAALEMRKAQELLESYEILRQTLDQREHATGGQGPQPPGRPDSSR